MPGLFDVSTANDAFLLNVDGSNAILVEGLLPSGLSVEDAIGNLLIDGSFLEGGGLGAVAIGTPDQLPDEIITPIFEPEEQRNRLNGLMVRTQTSVSVHPSTRLAGTNEIEREIRRRLDSGGEFAVCYADLDHFKEYNDRYSYYDGDRVIGVRTGDQGVDKDGTRKPNFEPGERSGWALTWHRKRCARL